jgi:hypothetical protein
MKWRTDIINPSNVNRLFLQAGKCISDLEARIAALEASNSATTTSGGTVELTDTDDEDALRARARAAGIKSWHVKSIETLKAELATIEIESN